MIANSAQFAVSKVASDDLDLVHASKRGSPELYLADTGLLCALLNIRSEEALQQSPAVGAVWETFVFAQLRDRERRGGRTGSLFFLARPNS
jgi:predicted AAA+ superfamily ATPase